MLRYLNEENKGTEKIMAELHLHELIDWFLASMLRKMPVICDICHDWHNTKDEKAVGEQQLICMICKRQSHGCKESYIKSWVCGTCEFIINEEETYLITIQDIIMSSITTKRYNGATKLIALKRKRDAERRKIKRN